MENGTFIKVIRCLGVGDKFANATPDSVHKVIRDESTPDYRVKGVWIRGVGEEVKLLNSEYRVLTRAEFMNLDNMNNSPNMKSRQERITKMLMKEYNIIMIIIIIIMILSMSGFYWFANKY